MKCFFKFNIRLVAVSLLLVVNGFMQAADFFNKHLGVLSWSFLLVVACFILLAFYTYMYFNVVRLAISQQSLLEITEMYIHDHVYDVKYYWADIEEIEPAENSLNIKMYDKAISPVKDENILVRYFIYTRKSNTYTIDLTFIKGNYNKLFDLLNDYSVKSLELKGE